MINNKLKAVEFCTSKLEVCIGTTQCVAVSASLHNLFVSNHKEALWGLLFYSLNQIQYARLLRVASWGLLYRNHIEVMLLCFVPLCFIINDSMGP